MSIVETDCSDGIMVIRMNRPEHLNALSAELRGALADTWCEFRDRRDTEVAIFTGAGRAFCAGGDLKEMAARNVGTTPGPRPHSPYDQGTLDKPVIAAVNGYAMGGGFTLVEHADLRVSVRTAVFEMSEAKRWLLGGYTHGYIGGMPQAIATEMAFAFRFTAERLYELGWLNRLVDSDGLMPVARTMAEHLMSLPPASRVNTLAMMRAMRPRVSPEHEHLAVRLRNHGYAGDLQESRRAFAEKRQPQFKGWDHPQDRYRTPTLESVRQEQASAG